MAVAIPEMPAPAEREIVTLAELFGGNLPDEYLAFISKHDGAEPEDNVFVVGTDNESGVRAFVRVAEVAELISAVEVFPAGCIPLAEDGCGNFVYIRANSAAVYFWDHEIDGLDTKLAPSLGEFLQQLAVFDSQSVQLAPGQVKSVWIDPTFEPEF